MSRILRRFSDAADYQRTFTRPDSSISPSRVRRGRSMLLAAAQGHKEIVTALLSTCGPLSAAEKEKKQMLSVLALHERLLDLGDDLFDYESVSRL